MLLVSLMLAMVAVAGEVNQALLDAAAKGDCKALRALLNREPARGDVAQALVLAIANGQREATNLLILEKADPNVLTPWGCALGRAASMSAPKVALDITKRLLAAGAIADGPAKDGAPMSGAARAGNYEVINALLGGNANPLLTGPWDKAKLSDQAAASGHEDCARLLRKAERAAIPTPPVGPKP